jgi:hypothetical protein
MYLKKNHTIRVMSPSTQLRRGMQRTKKSIPHTYIIFARVGRNLLSLVIERIVGVLQIEGIIGVHLLPPPPPMVSTTTTLLKAKEIFLKHLNPQTKSTNPTQIRSVN